VTIEPLQWERIGTPTGPMQLVLDAHGRLCALEWVDHDERMQRFLRLRFGTGGYRLHPMERASRAARAVTAYFEGELEALDSLETAARGTDFQRTVWDALRTIPVGTTISYGTLAARIGKASAVRAVGLANGANPIALVVPCHRVIGADGSLTGYGGGLDRKRWLLAHESPAAASTFVLTGD